MVKTGGIKPQGEKLTKERSFFRTLSFWFDIDDAEKITSEPHGLHMLLTRTCTIQKLKTLRGVPV